MKTGSLKKTNKIDKHVARVVKKKKREKWLKLLNSGMKKGLLNLTEINRTKKGCYQQWYANKLDKLDTTSHWLGNKQNQKIISVGKYVKI